MNILVISNNYPSNVFPSRGLFVYQIVQQFISYYNVKVISPTVIFKAYNKKIKKLDDEKAEVNFPNYLSFSNKLNLLIMPIIRKHIIYSIEKAYRQLYNQSEKPKFIYAHFLRNAVYTLPLKSKLDVPLFVAMGESSIKPDQWLLKNPKKLTEIVNNIDGFIVVSQKLKNFCLNDLNVQPNKILLAPNGVDSKKFFPFNNKDIARDKLNITKNKFIISFIGGFIERKGIFQLIEAAEQIENVQLICIGSGKIPKSESIIFAGPVPHERINNYLNASDAFVFPTHAEGSSNALLEAAACGLPIITSNIPEVMEQIGIKNGLFISPGNVSELVNAIIKIKDDEKLRTKLVQCSLSVASKYSIQNRAKIIMEWLEVKIKYYQNH